MKHPGFAVLLSLLVAVFAYADNNPGVGVFAVDEHPDHVATPVGPQASFLFTLDKLDIELTASLESNGGKPLVLADAAPLMPTIAVLDLDMLQGDLEVISSGAFQATDMAFAFQRDGTGVGAVGNLQAALGDQLTGSLENASTNVALAFGFSALCFFSAIAYRARFAC